MKFLMCVGRDGKDENWLQLENNFGQFPVRLLCVLGKNT